MCSFTPQQNECKPLLIASLYTDAFMPTDFQKFFYKPWRAGCWLLASAGRSAWIAGLWSGTLLPTFTVEQPSFNVMPAVNNSEQGWAWGSAAKSDVNFDRRWFFPGYEGARHHLNFSVGHLSLSELQAFRHGQAAAHVPAASPAPQSRGGSLLHLHRGPLQQGKSPPAKG